MKLKTTAFKDGEFIPSKYAFCQLTDESTVIMGENINPPFSWEDVPSAAKSLVLMCVDTEVPTVGDNVNKEGMVVPKDLPRTDFYHWVLVNIPSNLSEIAEGEYSSGITPHGKQFGGPHGTVQGINDYTGWFANDVDMAGDYYGYDGPCPPWNDERVHIYYFKLYALDVTLELAERFTAAEVLYEMEGHILAEDQISVQYSLNKNLV